MVGEIIFTLSIACPVYTYAIYPLVLKILPKRKRGKGVSIENIKIHAFIISKDIEQAKLKKKKLLNLFPKERLMISIVASHSEINKIINDSTADIILITDSKTELDQKAIRKIVDPLADSSVGCVVGILKKKENTDKNTNNSIYWKYENKVRNLESKIGCVSGTNKSLYVVRKELFPFIGQNIINPDFYISTKVIGDNIFAPDAIAYENEKEIPSNNFKKHIEESYGYFQSIELFKDLELKKGFVLFSHRVMKLLVPFNMMLLLGSNIVLFKKNNLYKIILMIQELIYIKVFFHHFSGKKISKIENDKYKLFDYTEKMLNLLDYFCTLNISILCGFYKYKKRNRQAGD